MYSLNINVIYFDSFVVEDIPKEIKTFTDKKNIKTNIYIIQGYNFCIGFIDFMLKDKSFTSFTDFTNLF